MVGGFAEQWFAKFMETVQAHETSAALCKAALEARLAPWTEALTTIVVRSCEEMGWKGAARGHRSSLLPVARQEYLSLDVVAFEQSGDHRWRFPLAVFELENSRSDDVVAYSLWKVLCVRASLRVVFCYRSDSAAGSQLVRQLSREVARAMEIQDRAALKGETLVIVGSRSDATTFPYGFFKDWLFDPSIGRFGRA